MESLSYPKISTAVNKLIGVNLITSAEHTHLLEYLQPGKIRLEKIENLNSADDVESEVLKLVRSLHKPNAVEISHYSNSDESSSPLGTFLHEKKKRQHAEHELKLSLATTEIEKIVESHEDH